MSNEKYKVFALIGSDLFNQTDSDFDLIITASRPITIDELVECLDDYAQIRPVE